MANGRPAFWSLVLGSIFVICGSIIHFREAVPGISIDLSYPEFFGLPSLVFGFFVILIGVYVQFLETSTPSFREAEQIINQKHPTRRVARAHILASIPFLVGTFYLIEYTFVPLIYPTGIFLLGLYYLSSGLYRYWRNTLTTYYITSDRVINTYRFLSLHQKEIPLNKIRGIEEKKSFMENLLNIGSIEIASAGGGGTVNIKIRNIEEPSDFANSMRDLIQTN